MSLPDKSAQEIRSSLSSLALLDSDAIENLLDCLNENRPMNWNIVLTQQFESEKKENNEAES